MTALTTRASKGAPLTHNELDANQTTLRDALTRPLDLSLDFSVASNALTATIKTAAGNTPSSTDPIHVAMRSATASDGKFTVRSITSAVSTTISSGSTAGHNSGLKQYIYWYLIDNAGTIELAWSSKFFGLNGIVSTTAEGGAGAADSGTVMYSTTARSNVAFLCVDYTTDTQTTAGTWLAVPTQQNPAPFTHPVISFSANKGGSNQTGIVTATPTKVSFGTEVWDNGSLFDSTTNYRWVPPPGSVRLTASLYLQSPVDQTLFRLHFYKNGSEIKAFDLYFSSTAAQQIAHSIDDECNGTDYYEVYVTQSTGSNKTVDGTTSVTFFQGKWFPERS